MSDAPTRFDPHDRSSTTLLFPGCTRRQFLLGTAALSGALLVGCAPEPETRIGIGDDLPLRRGDVNLNAWVRLDADGIVTVAVARAEMGQGVSTALPMLVAEELGCVWSDVRYELIAPASVHANTLAVVDALPWGAADTSLVATTTRALAARLASSAASVSAVTGRSTSVRDAWLPLRMAGAAARYALVRAAARVWQTSASELAVEDGQVLHPDGRTLPFGELAEAAARVPLPKRVRLKAPTDFSVLGKSLPRLDMSAKLDGSAVFGADVRLDDMRFASARVCPRPGGWIKSIDDTAARALPGVHAVVRVAPVLDALPAVVVVADDTWTARRAAALLVIDWGLGSALDGSAPIAPMHAETAVTDHDAELGALLGAINERRGTRWHADGDITAIEQTGARRFDAVYTAAPVPLTAAEPPSCTAIYATERGVARLTLWLATAFPGACVQLAARVADLTVDKVSLTPTLIGGGGDGGGSLALVEPVIQAVTAARAMPNVPVQLSWTATQAIEHASLRPAMAAKASAWLTGEAKAGRWLGWRLRSAGASPMKAALERYAPAWLAAATPDKSVVEGAFDTPYALDGIEVWHVETQARQRIALGRGGGHALQAFIVESFIDEVAHDLKQDPLDVRLRKLKNAPREAEVLSTAARLAGWHERPARGSALGLAMHGAFGSMAATVVHLVREDDGRIRIERIVCAIDCGFAVHPDGIAQQVEGGVLHGLTVALAGHPSGALRLASTPPIETQLITSRAPLPGGAGDVPVPPVAPALCNALFRLTGKRVRDLPIAGQVRFAFALQHG